MPPIPERKTETVVPRAKSHRELAINLYDLQGLEEPKRITWLEGKLDLKNPIQMDKRTKDEVGLLFICDLLVGACISELIRQNSRAVGDVTRVYLRRDGGKWIKLPDSAVLVFKDGDNAELNPLVFPEDTEVIEAPKPQRTFIGKKAT